MCIQHLLLPNPSPFHDFLVTAITLQGKFVDPLFSRSFMWMISCQVVYLSLTFLNLYGILTQRAGLFPDNSCSQYSVLFACSSGSTSTERELQATENKPQVSGNRTPKVA